MKLHELIDNVDRSEANASSVCLDELALEFDLSLDYVAEDKHQIRAYWLSRWCCTDTWVGLRVYGFERDDVFEPFAVSMQDARKSDEKFQWATQGVADEVREYLIRFMGTRSTSVSILDSLDEDMGEGFMVTYSGQLLTQSVIEKATGERVEVVKTFRDYGDIDKWGRVVIQRASGQPVELDMKDIIVPYCLAAEID